MFLWKAQEKGIQLSMNWNPGTPAAVTGDCDRLRQILLNLIGNAMKFTEHGEIAVSVAPAPDQACMLHFMVRDTGTGIASDKQAVIFEAFAQADGSSRRRQGGTGLGLAICSKLVRLMDGKIWVDSAPGAGSTFHFTACLRAAEALPDIGRETGRVGEALTSPAQPLRILLAEDNPVNQKLARFAIQKMGHSIVMVNNGLRAVKTSATGEFDLILMDLQMPEMDGFEATARIREAERSTGRHTPIVAMTAHAMHGDREQCLRAGMDDYLAKPIDLQALARMIERYRVPRPTVAAID
jgi:CheY-like chemotaxis protein